MSETEPTRKKELGSHIRPSDTKINQEYTLVFPVHFSPLTTRAGKVFLGTLDSSLPENAVVIPKRKLHDPDKITGYTQHLSGHVFQQRGNGQEFLLPNIPCLVPA